MAVGLDRLLLCCGENSSGDDADGNRRMMRDSHTHFHTRRRTSGARLAARRLECTYYCYRGRAAPAKEDLTLPRRGGARCGGLVAARHLAHHVVALLVLVEFALLLGGRVLVLLVLGDEVCGRRGGKQE